MMNFNPTLRQQLIGEYDSKYGMHPTNTAVRELFRQLNMINLNGSERIYRIYPWNRFLGILKSHKDSLVPTKKWDDPFENFILGSKAFHDGKEVSLQPIHNSWYGQCWSLTEESDGLWRSYTNSKKDRAVKVSTTVDKLFENFYNFSNNFHVLSFFVGKVEYISKNGMLNILSQNLSNVILNSDNIYTAISLLLKRQEFTYENEVRLLYNQDTSSPLPNYYQYDLDPSSVFDEIVIDPWADNSATQTIIEDIRKYGYNHNVYKSDLYSPNNHTIYF